MTEYVVPFILLLVILVILLVLIANLKIVPQAQEYVTRDLVFLFCDMADRRTLQDSVH